jgi:hypothetical protein
MQGVNGRRSWRPAARRCLVLAIIASLAALGSASSALATSFVREFDIFAHCPVNAPGITLCANSKVTGGEFKMGSTAVPINKTITLQGGLNAHTSELIPATDGNTLSKTPLTVPGGLLGVEGVGGEVTATALLAGPVHVILGNLFTGAGPLVLLPTVVKLDNIALGDACIIGTEAEPISLSLTAGTTNPPPPNEPITGSNGKVSNRALGQVTVVSGTRIVDNSFSAPGVNGCGGILSLVLDLAVDLKAGIPAAAGHNTAIMAGSFEEAESRIVKTEQEIPQFGRCTKVPGVKEGGTVKYSGRFISASCVTEIAESNEPGKFEWSPGPGPKPQFSGTVLKTTLETVGKHKIKCLEGTSQGEYTGLKTEKLGLTLTGCETTGLVPCQSASAASGEIRTSLAGTLGFINDSAPETPVVGVDLKPESGTKLATIHCGSVEEVLEGGAIATFTPVDKMVATPTLKFKEVAGKQLPEAFEETAPDTLTTTVTGGTGTEGTGLLGVVPGKGEEPIEVKARAF